MRDARRLLASLPFFAVTRLACRRATICALLHLLAPALLPALLHAQPSRPWLDWRTVETQHFVIHFTPAYRDWALALSRRIEGVRAQVTDVVGFVPPRRVHVLVDDPTNDANGAAYTTLDAPTIVLWPTPPSPREEIGNFRVWSELLATHEFAHVAHLVRPSRNRIRQLLWSVSPVPLGPIAARAPRWALEGYATYVEGRVTGSGRPNHAWRAAILRQFALQGRLPSYAALNATGGFETGSFAYLAGSAFLEWLARREGDSSVTAIWRRMTAKTDRSFGAAVAGVYGAPPAELYGRFSAELTADALALERVLTRDALVPGTLVQRLSRNTGDPAVSPDGRFIALTVRRTDAPSELVVWRTADEPDTLVERRRAAQRRRDPDDVPDRQFDPAPKKAVISLAAIDGAPYESPRWMPDNKRLLVTRSMPTANGTLRPDLFLWSAEDGELDRLTRGAALRDADPSADGRWAAAVRCDHGWCDLVRYDLEMRRIRVLRSGSIARNYHRPRVSPTTGEIAVAEQSGDRWRIALVSPETGELRYADPDDGATRYDVAFARDGRTLVATSDVDGIPNLERLDPSPLGDTAARLPVATPLTSVTGAAVGVDVAPDGTLWFLSLHANGYDLQRLRSDSASLLRARLAAAKSRSALIDLASPVLPPRRVAASLDSARRPALGAATEERAYGGGPTRLRYVPSITTGQGGTSALLAIVRSDPVGRLGVSVLGAVGAGALPAGVSAIITTRRRLTVLSALGWTSHEAAARLVDDPFDRALDQRRTGAALRAERRRVGEAGELAGSFTLLMERQLPSLAAAATRTAAVATTSIIRRQRDDATRYIEQAHGLVEYGNTLNGSYVRQRGSLFFGTARGDAPLTTFRVAYGTVGGGAGNKRERYAIGGFASPLVDSLLDARRVDAPAYPVGSGNGTSFSSWRVGLPLPPLELFYAAASPDLFQTSLRSYGVEFRQHVDVMPALGTPEVNLLAGIARAVDAPVKGDWRYYITLALRP